MKEQLRIALLCCATALFIFSVRSGYLHAQAVKGSLLGAVTDASGAVIPGASVTITEVNTNLTRSTVTNESGNYVFGDLDRGVYRVEVQLAGFKKAIRERADVLVNVDTRVDMRLEAGDITQSVEVVDTLPLLQTDRADVGRQIETKQLQDIDRKSVV